MKEEMMKSQHLEEIMKSQLLEESSKIPYIKFLVKKRTMNNWVHQKSLILAEITSRI